MLYYKNNRFHIGGVAYSLPDDICLISDFERTLNNGFAYKSLDQKILVTINTDSISGAEYFYSDRFNSEFCVEEIKPFGYADVKGLSAMYSTKYNEYYEVRLNLPRVTDENNTMIILIEVKKTDYKIKEAITNKIVVELLLSLRLDLSAPIFLF